MGNVTDLDAYRPHVNICVEGAIHVYPVQCLLDVAEGKLPLDTLGVDIWQRILTEWLGFIKDHPFGAM